MERSDAQKTMEMKCANDGVRKMPDEEERMCKVINAL